MDSGYGIGSGSQPRCPWLALVLVPMTMTLGCFDVPGGDDSSPVKSYAQELSSYYKGAPTGSAAALRGWLHDRIDNHERWSYSKTWDILEEADSDPNQPSRVRDIYRNARYRKQDSDRPYNREHSWPRSYGFPEDGAGNYPLTDCHALFISDSGYNSARNNKPYRTCTGDCTEKPTVGNDDANWTSGWNAAGAWETWSGRRGDVARALFYMDVRYEGGKHSSTGAREPDLVLTDDDVLLAASLTGKNEKVAYMGMLEELLEWHRSDPVDELERARNEVVYAYQGNRNPFIDHPEWVECIFEGECDGDSKEPVDPVDPVEPVAGDVQIIEFHYENRGLDEDEFVSIAGMPGSSLDGWRLLGYNGRGGAHYRSIRLEGAIPKSGIVEIPFRGLQNGSPWGDGIVLLDGNGAVADAVAYEGTFVATAGPAAGHRIEDIGVAENRHTPIGHSLKRSAGGWMAPTPR